MTKPIKSAAALTLAVSILLTLTGCSGKPDAVPTPTAAVQETPTPTPEPTPEPTAAPAPTPEPTATPNPNIPVITVVDATEPSDMKAGTRGSSRMSRGGSSRMERLFRNMPMCRIHRSSALRVR